MTMIAEFKIKNAPLLIGDVLLSGPKSSGRKFELPLVGDINKIFADNSIPFEVSVTQKLSVFNGRIAVAWAGSLIQAERVLKILSAIAPLPNLSIEMVFDEIDAIDPSAIDELWLIGFVLQEDGSDRFIAHHFELGVDPETVPFLGDVFAAGTGRKQIIDFLKINAEDIAGLDDPVQGACMMMATLIGEEVKTGGGLAELWGGGFEAIAFEDNEFRKVGNMLHTFWRAADDNRSVVLEGRFYKTSYFEDALMIRSVSLKQAEDGFKITSNSLHVVTPPLKSARDYDFTKTELTKLISGTLCCHVISDDDVFLHVEASGEQNTSLTISIDGDGAHLSVSKYLIKILTDALIAHRKL